METSIDSSDPDDGGPEELKAWLAAGFTRNVAEVWRRWRFSIPKARQWIASGVDDGLQAAQWSTAGVGPTDVDSWRQAGIGTAEAVRWHEMGFSLHAARVEKQKGNSPDVAFAQSRPQGNRIIGLTWAGGGSMTGPMSWLHQLREAGVDGRVIHSYMQQQWVDDDAVKWAMWGIEAQDAHMWHEMGLTPPEAGRLLVQGRTPAQVIREWWGAGIPFDECADWIGAGLSADEAIEQRARGITAEHAASLRALRQDDEPPYRAGSAVSSPLGRLGVPGSEQFGPPPADEAGARAEVKDAFTGMLTADEQANEIPAVDGGENLGPCLLEAAQRHGVGADGSGTAVSVDVVQFINDHEARVNYSVVVRGSRNVNVSNRPGRAVLIEGSWKVARETFCQFMQLAGVPCPPRKEEQ